MDEELKNAEGNLRKQAELLAKRRALKVKQLKDDAEFEKQKVTEDKTKYAELQAKEILKIDEKLKNDLRQNELDYLDDLKKFYKEQVQIIHDYVGQIVDGIAEGLLQRAELQQQYDQRDIDRQQRIIEIQTALAAAGKDNVLAEEQARLDKAEERRIQNEKKAAKQQQNLAIIKTFTETLNRALQSNKNFLQAFGEATAASGVVEAAFARLFSGFYDGTESLGEDGTVPMKNGKDDILVSAKKGERLIGYEDSKKISGLTNKEVVDAAMLYKNNDFNELYVPQFKSANVTSTSTKEQLHDSLMTQVLSNKIDSLQRAIESKPTQSVSLGRLGEWTETIENKGMKLITHHKRNRPSLRIRG